MKRQCVCLPNYVIGERAYFKAASVVKRFGHRTVIIGGIKAMKAGAEKLASALLEQGVELLGTVHYGGGLATYENARMLIRNELVQGADSILAMGGGSVCDTCKVVAESLGKPLFTCPTISSNCAPCTSLAIMYDMQGKLVGNYYSEEPPLYTFIDTDIITHAPVEYLRAGIGDALSKEAEVLLALRNVPMDQNLLLGKAMAHACTEPLLQYGRQALDACECHEINAALEETILDIIITTGLVSNMTVCPEFYYNTNLAHCFYYGATALPSYHDHAHGIWVSFGLLALLAYDGQVEQLKRVISRYRKLKLPYTLDYFGIKPEDLDVLVKKATTVPGWYIEGHELSAQRFHEAILHADALGHTLREKGTV